MKSLPELHSDLEYRSYTHTPAQLSKRVHKSTYFASVGLSIQVISICLVVVDTWGSKLLV